MAETIATVELPFELTQYITRRQRDACDANQCDHRATYQGELDGIRDNAIVRYSAGLELLAKIREADPADLGRCQRYYNLTSQYGAHELVEAKILGTWVLVPRYVTTIEAMRKVRQAVL